MNEAFLKTFFLFLACCVFAVFVGYSLSVGNFLLLASIVLLTIFIIAVVTPGYTGLLAFGLLNPFFFPVPIIRGVPFLLLILILLWIKMFLQSAHRPQTPAVRHCFTGMMGLFFGWVALRYCINPSIPNLTGFGKDVSGFRAYLNYGIIFLLILLLPKLITSREDLLRLIRWLVRFCAAFCLLLIPLVFTKSMIVASWLGAFGLYVTFFDNGALRFVKLPHFGVVLLVLAFLPRLYPASKTKRMAILLLGAAAVLLGGTRSGLIIGLASLLVLLLAKKRYLLAGGFVTTVGLTAGILYYIGEHWSGASDVGFLRAASLVSRRMSESSGASATAEWRQVRWRRAIEEIKRNPLLGKGYGGLDNAWIFSDFTQYESSSVEMDLATGNVHNGFLAAAYALGIPAVLLFLLVLGQQLFRSQFTTRRFQSVDPMLSESHAFVVVGLVGFIPEVYIGSDLNTPLIWFYLGMGVLLKRSLIHRSATTAKHISIANEETPCLITPTTISDR